MDIQQRLKSEQDRADTLHRNAQEEHQAAMQLASGRRGLVEALIDASSYGVQGTVKEFADGWAEHWLRVAQRLEENDGASLMRTFRKDPDPGATIARVLLDHARTAPPIHAFRAMLLEQIEGLIGKDSWVSFKMIFPLLRLHVESCWYPPEPVAAVAFNMPLARFVISKRLLNKDSSARAIAALEALVQTIKPQLTAGELEDLGVPANSVFNESADYWIPDVEFFGTGTRVRVYLRAKVIEYVTYRWQPRAVAQKVQPIDGFSTPSNESRRTTDPD